MWVWEKVGLRGVTLMLEGQGRNTSIVEYALLLSIVLAGILFYSWMLLKDPFIPGVDGAYYLIQVESLVEHGTLKYGDPPFFFYASAALAILLGDPTLAVCLLVSIFSSLSAIPAYFLIRRTAKGKIGGYAAALSCVFSPQLVRMAGDLMKNAVGVFFLLSFICFLHKALLDNRMLDIALSTILFYMAFITHALDFGFALLILLVYFPFTTLVSTTKGENAITWVFILSTCILLVTISYVTFPYLFSDIKKGFKFLRDLFMKAQPPLKNPPAAPPLQPPPKNPVNELLSDPYGAGFSVPALIAGSILAYRELKRRSTIFPLIASALVADLLCIIAAGMPEWGWRFRLMSLVPIPITIGFLVSRIEDNSAAVSAATLLAGIIAVGSIHTALTMKPAISPEEYYELLEASMKVPPNSVVVVDCHVNMYWVEYLLGVDRALRLSSDLWGEYSHVLVLTDLKRPPPPYKKLLYKGKIIVLLEMSKPP